MVGRLVVGAVLVGLVAGVARGQEKNAYPAAPGVGEKEREQLGVGVYRPPVQ